MKYKLFITGPKTIIMYFRIDVSVHVGSLTKENAVFLRVLRVKDVYVFNVHTFSNLDLT